MAYMVKKLSYFARNLKKLRKISGQTQAVFAEAVGLSEQSIKDLESGRSNGTMPTLLKIANHLNVPLDLMMSDMDSVERDKVKLTPSVAEDLGIDYKLLAKIASLNERHMGILKSTVDTLYELQEQMEKNKKDVG